LGPLPIAAAVPTRRTNPRFHFVFIFFGSVFVVAAQISKEKHPTFFLFFQGAT
jgi:hypothetical protein